MLASAERRCYIVDMTPVKAHVIGLIVCLGLSAKIVLGHGSVHEIIARPKDPESYCLRSFAHRNLGHVESVLSGIISAINVHRSAPLEYYLFAVELLVEKTRPAGGAASVSAS